ncbi:phosphatidylserine decarboxylase-domain-containing protein [Neurospora hispaniola]|uniref:Phosphatidylserine decarboxylase-domain-containing protein n=1 Tax=Neurospora hispaniola TaxID=588809 RepID=A0AAJ0I718_9PEZI|nr:phosphatidylserine decarboxylase-domain-containing protein [Neurospora hispaniola]
MGRQETIPIIATEKLHPSVNALWHLIEDNREVRLLFTQMLQQIPNGPLYDKNPTGGPQFRNWMGLLCAFNNQLTQGPVWLYDTPGQQGLTGFPFNALLNWSMSTPAGLLAFHRPDVNAHFHDILTAYGKFLSSPASVAVLNSSATGWLSPTALDALAKTDTSDDPRPQFHDLFVSNPLHPTYGFSSWDAFFTRRFRPGIRPLASPSDDGVIVNACESTPMALERGVKLHDEFWIKGQPYSLTDKELEQAMRFKGGTIYQGFLGALSYHRWHAPVSGVVEKVEKIQGTYFAGCPGLASREDLHDGEERELDPSAPDRSQRYLCQVGTRALVYIRAKERRLGTVVFVAVGMAEVSSCEVTVKEGDLVEKGEEIGMFHYGGSTHCLIFEPGVRLKFTDAVEEVDIKRRGHNLQVNGYLAEVVSN